MLTASIEYICNETTTVRCYRDIVTQSAKLSAKSEDLLLCASSVHIFRQKKDIHSCRASPPLMESATMRPPAASLRSESCTYRDAAKRVPV